jgi:shikimate dehydrogenase
MPYEQVCIPYLDELDPSAQGLGWVNTIVNDDGYLRGYNTDYIAVPALLGRHGLLPDLLFVLRGSGGMASAVAGALHDAGFHHAMILARNEATGTTLAARYGYQWLRELGGVRPELLVNVTPIGTAGAPEAGEMAFEPSVVDAAGAVFDVVAMPAETALIRYAREQGKPGISGAEVIDLQAAE